MKKSLLLKSKKGAITDIFGGIIDSIKTVFDLIPNPVKILLFVFFIGMIGNAIQSGLSTVGIFCDSNNIPVKLKNSNILTNMALTKSIPDADLLALNGGMTEETSITTISQKIGKCSALFIPANYVKTLSDGSYDMSNIYTVSEGSWVYDGDFCTDCERILISTDLTNTGGLKAAKQYCFSDVYHKEPKDMDIFTRFVCQTLKASCNPPEGSYWDATNNIYVQDTDSEFVYGNETIGERWDRILKDKGAVPMYPFGENFSKSYTDIFSVKCVDVEPRFSIFGIQVFDYKLWIFILVLVILFWVYKNVKH